MVLQNHIETHKNQLYNKHVQKQQHKNSTSFLYNLSITIKSKSSSFEIDIE